LPKKKKKGNGAYPEKKEVPNDFYKCTKCNKYAIVYIIHEPPKRLRCVECGGLMKEVPPLVECLNIYRERQRQGAYK
jgi:hypothetical protein